MQLRLKQWKGRLALYITVCIVMLFTGCGAGAPGGEAPDAGALGTETLEVGTSETKTPETKAARGEDIGAGTADATSVEAAGAETTREETAAVGTSDKETSEIEATKGQSSEIGTSDAKAADDSKQSDNPSASGAQQNVSIDEAGSYTTKEDVALYLETYEKLPGNFITKQEARKLGWEGGSLEPYAPGKCIGGDKFGNYEGLLPAEKGRTYRECDIDTLGADSRGAKRIVYSDDGLIYYTEDHYTSFTLLYD
ncbi:MAG: hypothetical protein NC094_08870 [Bacteroidales bacterium]|nr:ribonuclease [Lachnoclostridium sp.]MCM1385305.1 ribonuclease [Lachnoclostridium sp.]MCM1465517.1 hypothetical protein [Bacteroidales bacterium]